MANASGSGGPSSPAKRQRSDGSDQAGPRVLTGFLPRYKVRLGTEPGDTSWHSPYKVKVDEMTKFLDPDPSGEERPYEPRIDADGQPETMHPFVAPDPGEVGARGIWGLPALRGGPAWRSYFLDFIQDTFGIRSWTGVMVGPSGSGKTNLASDVVAAMRPTATPDAPTSLQTESDVAEGSLVGIEALQATGLNSIPTLFRPYHVLSEGERHRGQAHL